MEDHQASIAQMMEIAQCSESIAVDYLSRTNFDVETAIRHFFEGTSPESIPRIDDRDEHVQPSSSSSSDSASSGGVQNLINNERAVLPRYHTILQLFASFLMLPVRLPLILMNIVYDYFFGQQSQAFNHIFDYIESAHPSHGEKMRSVFYGQQLQNLRTDIQRNNWKWLVAYIHDPKGNQNFLLSLLDSDFAEKVSSRGGIFFGTVRGSDDASRRMSMHSVHAAFKQYGLLPLKLLKFLVRPDRTFGSARKSCIIIFIIQGNILKRKLLIEDLGNSANVFTNVDSALIELIAEEADRVAQETMRSESRRLMEEQNREYQESLQRDLERIEKAKTQEAELKKEQEREQREKIDSENRKKKIENYKDSISGKEMNKEGNCDLLIRYPTGKKVIKFNEHDNIETLFDKALSSEMCPLYFQLHQNLPRRAVPCLPQWYFQILEQEKLEPNADCVSKSCTFREAGLTHGEMVYIDSL